MSYEQSDPTARIGNTNAGDTGINNDAFMQKLDRRLVPWLAVLYFLSFLDRGSIGNARLYNMEQDLGITDTQYLIALTVFFFPYSLFEPPSNIILRRLRPAVWLSSMVFFWGIIMMCHGFLHDFGGLAALRCLLGLFEAGLYPGIVFFLSCWYKRSELGTRVAAFFTSATIAGAFSGLLAAGISKMDGVGGLPGWSWIFILEGLATLIAASASFLVIPGFPENARFLSAEERSYAVQRLKMDMQFSAGGERFQRKYIWQALSDWKTYLAMGIYMGFDGPLFAFSLFTPTIIQKLGFDATQANLLSVPVYAWASIVTVLVGVVGDRIGSRGYINLTLFGTGLAGYIILLVSRNPKLSYFAVYLAAAGIYPTIPNSVAWVASNTEGAYKRSVVLGMAIGWGNLNGAVTSNVYRSNDAPWYPLGHGIVLTYIGISWISSLAYMVLLRVENRKRDAGQRDEVIIAKAGDTNGDDAAEAHTPSEGEKTRKSQRIYTSVDEIRRERGDLWSGFRYTL